MSDKLELLEIKLQTIYTTFISALKCTSYKHITYLENIHLKIYKYTSLQDLIKWNLCDTEDIYSTKIGWLVEAYKRLKYSTQQHEI